MWCLLISVALSIEPSGGQATPEKAPSGYVEVPIHLRQPAIPLTQETRDAVRRGRWDDALPLLRAAETSPMRPSEKADLAFVEAWGFVAANRPLEAVGLLDDIGTLSSAPMGYLLAVRAAVLTADGKSEAALAELAQIPNTWVGYGRAMVLRAQALDALGRSSEGLAILQEVASRPDPMEGNGPALLALSKRFPAGSDDAYQALRRVWTWYGGTPEATEASELLKAFAREATATERLDRGERLMDGGMNDAALSTVASLVGGLTPGSMESCRLAFIRGRSLYKKNDLAGAVAAFSDAGRRCGATQKDYGAKILYLQGYAEFRRARYPESAGAYRAISELYPSSSMADDGLARGGHSLWEGGDRAGAMATWTLAMDNYPQGDTTPEATFRLAFAHYEDGRTDEAIRVAEKLGRMDGRLDYFYVPAGRYWAPRWRMYPDVHEPNAPVASAKATAVAGWTSVMADWPQNYYALLSYARLMEVDPVAAKAAAVRPPADDGFGPWQVRRAIFDDPRVGYGVAMARLGLLTEAMAEWAPVDVASLDPEEVAWLQELRSGAGEWLGAHKYMQQYLKTHPVGTLGPREAQIIALAYPDRYWDDIQALAGKYDYQPRAFHALVREESSFDKDIVSFAGARGLSQVMPATAREVARWLGLSLSDSQMFDARINLNLGSRYFSSVYGSMSGNPFLAMASYNGGPGRIKGWVSEWGNPPTDEYVERIPVRETRDYVKKVSTTWQIMNFSFDRNNPPFPDLSKFNHAALP